MFDYQYEYHRLGQNSIHRWGQSHTNLNTAVRNKPAARGGPRSPLHLSVISIYTLYIYILRKNNAAADNGDGDGDGDEDEDALPGRPPRLCAAVRVT
eukprot:COSAG02_NODE_14472_length_1267_cov_22.080479_1_plen_97_part_00